MEFFFFIIIQPDCLLHYNNDFELRSFLYFIFSRLFTVAKWHSGDGRFVKFKADVSGLKPLFFIHFLRAYFFFNARFSQFPLLWNDPKHPTHDGELHQNILPPLLNRLFEFSALRFCLMDSHRYGYIHSTRSPYVLARTRKSNLIKQPIPSKIILTKHSFLCDQWSRNCFIILLLSTVVSPKGLCDYVYQMYCHLFTGSREIVSRLPGNRGRTLRVQWQQKSRVKSILSVTFRHHKCKIDSKKKNEIDCVRQK